jgi:hypothetical protein
MMLDEKDYKTNNLVFSLETPRPHVRGETTNRHRNRSGTISQRLTEDLQIYSIAFTHIRNICQLEALYPTHRRSSNFTRQYISHTITSRPNNNRTAPPNRESIDQIRCSRLTNYTALNGHSSSYMRRNIMFIPLY